MEAHGREIQLTYASHTRNDNSRLKRLVHRRRLVDALNLARQIPDPRNIVDFGAGDGDVCCHLADVFSNARLYCYEPAEHLRAEAVQQCAARSSISVVDTTDHLPDGCADLVFCAEVFEHLPPAETDAAFAEIRRLIGVDGHAIISVPAEIYLAGLAKGCFRFLRRRGQFDAQPGNILRASLGLRITDRPIGQIAAGLAYHFHHTGFDYRQFELRLSEAFTVTRSVGSPCRWLPLWMNSEVYFVLRPRAASTRRVAA